MSNSFSDQVSGFPTENENENTEEAEEVETSGPGPEVLPAPVNPEPSVDDMKAETAVNTGYIAPEDAELEPTLEAYDEGGVQTVEQEFVLAAHMDPMRQKDAHGTYADDQRRRQQEVANAQREGREPDFDNLPIGVGDVVITKSQAAQRSTAEPVRGIPVAFTAEVVVGEPEVHDAQGNVPEEEDDE